jgi:capsule polysaccharide export protein KpsE/RkpR
MTYWIRDGNDVSAAYYDINNALVDAIADMLPALREETRRRSVEAAQEQVRQAERKLARLQAAGRGAQA